MEDSRINPRWYVQSLEEFYFCINCINDMANKNGHSSILWFRGHQYEDYNLSPSLFRSTQFIYNRNETYSINHLREEYRYQHFKSRNYTNLECMEPNSIIEWLEIMQHHFSKTRLMDWSESAQIALLFALEPFVNPIKEDRELEEKRRTASPTVWVLNPAELNKRIYRAFAEKEKDGRYHLIERALKSIVDDNLEGIAAEIGDELNRAFGENNLYHELPGKDENEHAMDGIISLSSLEWIKKAFCGKEVKALRSFELNPFFYLLLRYYSDGVPVDFEKLPPLPIIHPYHSQRIQAQKGAFTVFPFYIPDGKARKVHSMGVRHEPMSMENIKNCKDLLYEIKITNPRRIAKELLITGERRSNLYPDMQTLTQEIENGFTHF